MSVDVSNSLLLPPPPSLLVPRTSTLNETKQRNVEICVKTALERVGLKTSQLAAAGITNQRESTLVWDKHTGTPLHRLIVWNDVRTESICRSDVDSLLLLLLPPLSRSLLFALLLLCCPHRKQVDAPSGSIRLTLPGYGSLTPLLGATLFPSSCCPWKQEISRLTVDPTAFAEEPGYPSLLTSLRPS